MPDTEPKPDLTDEQWRERLTPEQYEVLRRHGTERPFTGDYVNVKEDGIYRFYHKSFKVFYLQYPTKRGVALLEQIGGPECKLDDLLFQACQPPTQLDFDARHGIGDGVLYAKEHPGTSYEDNTVFNLAKEAGAELKQLQAQTGVPNHH